MCARALIYRVFRYVFISNHMTALLVCKGFVGGKQEGSVSWKSSGDKSGQH